MPQWHTLSKLIRRFRATSGSAADDFANTSQQETQYRLLGEFLRNTQDGFRMIDTHGRIVEANETYCRLVGYTRDELIQMNIREIDFPDDPAHVDQRIECVIKQGAQLVEIRQRRKDGTFFHAEVASTFLNAAGGDGCFADWKELFYTVSCIPIHLPLNTDSPTLTPFSPAVLPAKSYELFSAVCRLKNQWAVAK